MRYSNIDYTVFYVDPSIASAGDGSTPATALQNLPESIAEYANNSCFIIRRTSEDYAATIAGGTNATMYNLMLLGMPNASDLMYEFVPDEAKTAWGADEAEYANLESTSTSYVEMNSIQQFMLHRIYLYRNNATVSNYIFRFYNSSTYNACISIEHCKFGSKGIDIDQADYTCDKMTNSYLKAYFYIYYARLLNIKDVILNYAATSHSSHGIYCRFAEILNVEDVTVYALVGVNNSYYPLCLSETGSDGVECNIRNVQMKIKFNGDSEYLPTFLQVQGYLNNTIHNISVAFDGAINDTRPSNLCLNTSMIVFNSLRDFSITDVDINIPYCWRLSSSSGNVFRMSSCYAGTYVPGVAKEVKNINIVLGSDEDVAIGISNTYTEAKSDDDDYVALFLQFNNDACDNFFKVPIVDNINVVNPRGRSLYIYNARLTNATLQGAMSCYYTLADIDLLETWYPGYVLWAYYGSHVRVKELNVNLENPTYPYTQESAIGSSYSSKSNVFVEKSNCYLASLVTDTSESNNIYQGFTCNNEVETGHFCQRTPNGICDTWSVYREGGSSASLKLYNNSYNTTKTMVLGRRPFKGMQLLPTTTGRHTLKMHIAYKGYLTDSDIYQRLILSATVQTEDGEKNYISSVHGSWADDSESTWVNDESLTQKCLEMPLDLPNSEAVDIRIYFSWYAASGFVYIDPDITLETETEV